MTSPPRAPDPEFNSALAAAVERAQLSDVERDEDVVTGSLVRKRSFREARAGSRLASVSLVRDDDVLRWVYEPPPASPGRRRGRRSMTLHESRRSRERGARIPVSRDSAQ
jgi:hypothetical protein